MRPMAGWAVMACAGLLGALPAAAQEASELKRDVETLKAEVQAIRQAAGLPTTISSTPVDPVVEEETAQDPLSPLVTALKETKVSGFVDVGYMKNLQRPADGVTRFRAFDTEDNGFLLHHAQLMLERTATKEMIAGYRIRIAMGEDARVLGPVSANVDDNGDTSVDSDYLTLEEAYVQILAPVGNGLDIKVGRMATLAGYEVIESMSNYNYSRSHLFWLAIPFTHVGIRGTYAFSDEVSATLGVNNGWDVTVDNNEGKTLEAQLALKPIKDLFAAVNLYYGAERAADNDKRMLVDIVVTYTMDKLTLGANVDFGQEDFDDLSTPTGEDEDSWVGFALYGKYQINTEWAVALRFDRFTNEEGSRTGSALDPTLTGITGTVEFRPISQLILRGEVRFDSSDEDVFLDHSDPDDAQQTIGFEAIFVY